MHYYNYYHHHRGLTKTGNCRQNLVKDPKIKFNKNLSIGCCIQTDRQTDRLSYIKSLMIIQANALKNHMQFEVHKFEPHMLEDSRTSVNWAVCTWDSPVHTVNVKCLRTYFVTFRTTYLNFLALVSLQALG